MNETPKIEYKPGCCYVTYRNGAQISADDLYSMSLCSCTVSDVYCVCCESQ